MNKRKNTLERALLPPNYKPSAEEKFMNPLHLEYFRRKLNTWKKNLIIESNKTIESLQSDALATHSDGQERFEIENAIELRIRDRYRKLIAKIDESLERIDQGNYGYCQVTDEPIPLERLEARPTANMTVEAQEIYEREERTHKDFRDNL